MFFLSEANRRAYWELEVPIAYKLISRISRQTPLVNLCCETRGGSAEKLQIPQKIFRAFGAN